MGVRIKNLLLDPKLFCRKMPSQQPQPHRARIKKRWALKRVARSTNQPILIILLIPARLYYLALNHWVHKFSQNPTDLSHLRSRRLWKRKSNHSGACIPTQRTRAMRVREFRFLNLLLLLPLVVSCIADCQGPCWPLNCLGRGHSSLRLKKNRQEAPRF
jgi:hypothetical protein